MSGAGVIHRLPTAAGPGRVGAITRRRPTRLHWLLPSRGVRPEAVDPVVVPDTPALIGELPYRTLEESGT